LRFVLAPGGLVFDLELDLFWTKTATLEMDWDSAQQFALKNNSRLPTIRELQSLVVYDKEGQPIDTDYFEDTKRDWYWSSTERFEKKNEAYCISFIGGCTASADKAGIKSFRMVFERERLLEICQKNAF